MFWIITKADTEGAEPFRIGHGYLPFSNHGPGKDILTVGGKIAWVGDYLKTHGSMFTHEWRTFDDDGGKVYQGLCGNIDEADQDNAFAPLDYSMADCGATYMECRKLGETIWSIL